MTHKHGPIYDWKCPDCQVASVIGRRPSKKLQLSHIEYLVTYHGVNKDELVARLKK